MAAVLWGLLGVFAGVAAVAVAAMATPVRLGLVMRTEPEWHVDAVMRLFAGLTPPIPLRDADRARKEKKKKAKPKKKRRDRSRMAVRLPRILAAVPRLLIDLITVIHVDRLAVDAEIGFDDPADTGQLFGLLYAVRYARRSDSPVSIDVRPDFTQRRFSGAIDAEVRFVPVAFVPPGVRFAWRAFGPRP